MMPIDCAVKLLDAIRAGGLLSAAQLDEVEKSLLPRQAGAPGLAAQLVQRRWLTRYQAELLLAGRGPDLLLGGYLLLEPLGEGGMGQVFKARHQLMNRLVALKVIRPELLASDSAVQRFQREIQLGARLSHPNIVTSFDAVQAGGRCLLAMEFCEGPSLGGLVRRQGPLPVGLACAYTRQAALGLQHAFEQGMIHRDIKPENLVVSGGALKILDLGLARLWQESDAERLETLTRQGITVGTPDFMSPEQAKDSRNADIRSDLYSLGCTLYFALTGQPPFPGGTAVEKILRHELEPPTPLARLRPDVPPALRAIVDKLLAKRAADRYQTPAELAAALAPFADATSAPTLNVAVQVPVSPTSLPTPAVPPVPPVAPYLVRPAPALLTGSADTRRLVSRLKRRWMMIAVGACLLIGTLAVSAAFFFGNLTRRPDTKPILPSPARWRVEAELRTQEADIFGVSFSPDGTQLAVAGGSGEKPKESAAVLLYDVGSGRLARELADTPVSALRVAFAPDGRTIAWATGADDEEVPGEVSLWDVRGGKVRAKFLAHADGVFALAFEPAGRLLATAGRDPVIMLWDAATGKPIGQLAGHRVGVLCLAFSRDGTRLASAGVDKSVRLWNLSERKELDLLPAPPGGFISGLAFGLGDRTLVATTGVNHGDLAEIRVWDLATRQLSRLVHGEVHISCMALAPDGKTLATGCPNGLLQIWDLDEGQPIDSHPDTCPTIRCVTFSADGQTIATGHIDGELRLWRPRKP